MDPDRDAFDELTALFTTEPESEVQVDADTAQLGLVGSEESDGLNLEESTDRSMHVTVAICGHLPVMAGLWVTQFADRVGETHGSTGLLRLEGGRCSLELFRTPREFARVDQGSSLLDSIGSIAQSVRRWIVCVDEKDAAEAVRAGVEEVVVLTGADKPAVLAAYRIAKTAGARVHAGSTLDLGLVVVGASEERTAAVGEVLAVAAEEFMGRPLEVVDTIQRMDVVESARRMLFAERERATPAESIEMLRSFAPELDSPLDSEEVVSDPEPHSEPEPELEPESELESESESEPEIQQEDNQPEVDVESTVALRFVESEVEEVMDEPVSIRSTSHRGVRLAPVVPPSPAEPETFESLEAVLQQGIQHEAEVEEEDAADLEVEVELTPVEMPASKEAPAPQKIAPVRRRGEEGLCAHFPEYTRLDFHCPVAKSVELALDAHGRMRLLCRDNELADARMAMAWAQSNEKLIRAAVSTIAGSTLTIMIDLVTDSAERVADLHRTGVRLYLLTPLDVGDDIRWFRVDLNSEETAQIPE